VSNIQRGVLSRSASFWFTAGNARAVAFRTRRGDTEMAVVADQRSSQKKEPGGCSRIAGNFKYPAWRVSKVSGRITRAGARMRATRAKARAVPPIHRDFRQLDTGVIVIGRDSRRGGRRSKSRVTRPSTLFARLRFSRLAVCETGSAEAFEVSNRPWFHSMNHFRDVSRRVNAETRRT